MNVVNGLEITKIVLTKENSFSNETKNNYNIIKKINVYIT